MAKTNKRILNAWALSAAVAASTWALIGSAAAAEQLTYVGQGGASQKADTVAILDPVAKRLGITINQDSVPDAWPIMRSQVASGKPTWDVVKVATNYCVRGAAQGLVEKLDFSKIPNAAAMPAEYRTDYSIVYETYSSVLGYSLKKYPDATTAPKTWADFWDVKKFPGKRGMRKGARYNLEFALMADGVKAADVYKVLGTKDGADRAFKKLGELKPHIQWWEAGALPPQFLVAGDVAMTTAFSGRIDAAQREGQNLKITWTGGIYDLDFWVMPKGGANKEAAMKFIALASSPDAQAEYARHISYGPTHTKAMAKIDPKVQALLPTSPANSKDALRFDVAFWADQGEALEKRFAAWAAQ